MKKAAGGPPQMQLASVLKASIPHGVFLSRAKVGGERRRKPVDRGADQLGPDCTGRLRERDCAALRSAFRICPVRNSFSRLVLLAALMTAVLSGDVKAGEPQKTAPLANIGSIHVSGEKRFSAEQVIAAVGLKPGQVFDQKDLDAAMEKLGKSGAFQTVSYSYKSEGGLISVELKVEEAAKFRACVFDNFVWLSGDEIQTRLKKDLPLYDGMAPETGDMLDEISGELEKLTQEKGVTAHVNRRIEAGRIGDPNWSHLYVAEGPKVTIQSFRFTGVAAMKPADLEHQAEQFIGRDYSGFRCELYGKASIVPFYRERGYLRASLETPKTNILSRSGDSSEFRVEVIYTVTEGSAYKWAAPEWSGNQAMSAEALEAMTGLKNNDLANGKKIDEGWEAVRKAYSKSGYFEASLSPEPLFEEESKTIHYRVVLMEGPQYRMGSFVVTGLPPGAVEKLKKKWRLKEGDVFDQSAVTDFMKKDAPAALQGAVSPASKIKMTTQADHQRHLVNVTFQVE
jgi:outer membrane protein assembly factor BamA